MRVGLVLVGGGKMGQALLRGLLAAGWSAPELAVVEVLPGARASLQASFPGVAVGAEPVPAEGAVLATKPPEVPGACRDLAASGTPRVLSIAAGVAHPRLPRRPRPRAPAGSC